MFVCMCVYVVWFHIHLYRIRYTHIDTQADEVGKLSLIMEKSYTVFESSTLSHGPSPSGKRTVRLAW